VMPAIEVRRRRKVIAIPESSLRGPTTFRLRPYEEADHADFDRPDKVHHEALRWLEQASEPFLYMTGFSGTGKSSLLHAWLVPELAAREAPTRTVVARSYADPLGQLVDALTRPGVIWDKRPASVDDPRLLLQRAAERVRPGRLLIAIDQFEECLILQDEADEGQLAELFRDLREAPIPGLTFLLMLRDDYLDFDALRGLGLPEVRSDGNWFKLNALSRGDARQLLDERLKIDETLREKVLDEASEVDDLPGLVRPITLNMLGLVLQRFRGGALTLTAPGRLIQDYLRQAMAKPGIDQVAPRLLEQMITDKGTKRPIEEPTLAEQTGVEPALVRKTLLLLAQEGVVRELEPERRVWEISHDFVARQLGQIIPRLRPSAFHRVQKKMAPAALGAWLVLLPLLGFAIPEGLSRYARNALTDRGVKVLWSNELKGYSADFGEANAPGIFDRLNGWLPWIRGLRELTIARDSDLQTIVFGPGLSNLRQLNIGENPALHEIQGFDHLTSLTQLEIYVNPGLKAIDQLDGLGGLNRLSISGNAGLRMIKFGDLANLRQLWVSDNNALQTIDGLSRLANLTQLEISYNGELRAIHGLDSLANLTQLSVSRNGALREIPGLNGLANLIQLKISDNDALERISALESLVNLSQLKISYNDALQEIGGFNGLADLTQLEISRNDALQEVEGLEGLTSLGRLRIWGNALLREVTGINSLPRLQTLWLQGQILPRALTQAAALPMLKRVLLPVELEGLGLSFVRPVGLTPVEIGFTKPGSPGWYEP
jgi:Leucine-rich repeat (LRR) protein